MIDIDEGDYDQDCSKDEENQKIERQSESHEQKQGQYGGDQLNQRVAPRYFSAAITAFCAQNKKTDDRDVVKKTDWMVTVWTLGKRPDDGFFCRYAENTDIEKAADCRTEYEGKKI